ncbi:MAG: TonB-dependent receptor, partial [Candidatus Angelobacter sp.]
HEVFVHSEFDVAKRFEFDPMYRYVSSLPAQNVRAYQTADLRLAWNLKHLALSVTGENLLQPHHAEFGMSPGPTVLIKRSIYAKVVWKR